MADNKQNPKTKVNPLNAGLGIEGLRGYNPQEQTQEIKKESQVYTVTKNDGTQVDKSYNELSQAERAAANTTGIVKGGKTDIEQQYMVAPSSVGIRPTRPTGATNTIKTISSAIASTALGAKMGPIGAAVGAGMVIVPWLVGTTSEELEFQKNLREYNDKVAKESTLAGSWEKSDDGNLIFMPDYSKIGEDINVEASGAKISELFNLEEATEPDVYFTGDGVLHVDINGAFANTDEYNSIINSVASDYAGLTKDTEHVDDYLESIKQRLSSALEQYRFEVNRVASYKSKLPNASVEAIMDASRGEIGAMLADADKKDWTVNVYRDGEIVESNAADVLDNVYNMKSKYERDDYLETLGDMLNDDSISDDNKAYILAEYNLLFSASDAEVKEGDDERKKYSEMLDQDFLVTVLRSSGIIRGVDDLIDGVAKFVSQGEADDILIANQNYLEPEEVAKNFGAVVGTAFDVYASQKIMQGIEQNIVRPVLGGVTKDIGRKMIASGSDKLGELGNKLITDYAYTAITDSAGNIIGHRTALDLSSIKAAGLQNVIEGFNGAKAGLSNRLLAQGAGQIMAYSLGELSINFASDVLFDATKLGAAAISGEVQDGDGAAEYFWGEVGQDLAMDLIFQYGPMGMYDLHTTSDAIRLQNIEPYARGVAEARTAYGDALNAVDAARTAKESKKKISQLESDVVAKKNDLTKAETEYEGAMGKWAASGSQKFGAKLADLESRLTEHEMYRKFQEVMVDENAAGTALARSAYAASGGDVNLFNRLMNGVSNNLRTITRITANEMAADKYAKGMGEALNAFKQKYSDLANRAGKLSEADVNYIKAKNELIRYTEAANGDQEKIKAAETYYSKYTTGVDSARAAQLDGLMDTMRGVVNKTNESAIKAGIETEENIQTKRSATGFQEQGYIPMYLRKKNKSGHYIIPQERNLDHTWDRGEFWDIDNLENPALNTLTYVNYTARNIAINERNKAIIAASEIPGMRTHRTDVDNEVIKTEDGHVYKHSDIIGHMEPKIDKRLNSLDKAKRDAPTELEFSDEKNKILYGKVDGTRDDLVGELRSASRGTDTGPKDAEVDGHSYAGEGGYQKFIHDNLSPNANGNVKDKMLAIAVEQSTVTPGGDTDSINPLLRSGELVLGGDGEATSIEFKERIDNIDVYALAANYYNNTDYFDDGYSESGIEQDIVNLARELLGKKPLKNFYDFSDEDIAEAEKIIRSNLEDDFIRALKKGNYTLKNDAILYRVISEGGNGVNQGGDLSWLDKKSGKYSDKGFTSVTLNEDAVLNSPVLSGTGKKYILRYHIPSGENIYAFDGSVQTGEDVLFGDTRRASSGHRAGGEFMLTPGNSGTFIETGIFKNGAEYVDVYIGNAAINKARDELRTEVSNRIDALKKYYNDTYGKFGYTTDVRVNQAKIDGFIERNDMEGLATYLEGLKDRASLARPTDQEISDTAFEKQVRGLERELKNSINKNFPGLSNEQKRDVYSRVLGEFRQKAMESGNITAKQVAEETFSRNVGYPITYYENGEEKTAYIDGPLAKPIYEMCVRSENVADRNFVQKILEGAGKLKRYTTTAIDVARALPNLLRDTLRGDIMSGGTDYAGARKIFTEILNAEDLTPEQKAKAMESIELAIKTAQGQTLNAAVENRTERGLQDMVRETRQEGKNMVSRIIWDVTHGRIGHALETPMNVAEMYTRRRMAESAFAREFKDAKYTSTSFNERLDKAYNAGVNAGFENTTNFSRRGSAVGYIARYVPYFQQNFANIESANNAFLKDPAGVAARAAIFQYAYVMMLAETLKKEETRRAYYNLSDYDRKNNVVFSLDGDTLVTIPLDESLASLTTPWRRTLETLNNVDPGTFASILTDTMLDLSPLDLDGFTEGDGLNVKRGIEKLASQVAPSLATEMIQTITGYNLYYGSDNAVTDETLAQSGRTAESAGDYTTAGANSKLLRKVADATGIPQWQLQQAVSNFGGNVGQYVLNTLDKLAGASKDEQGGREFINAVFKSMTGTDSENVKSQFYNGINILKKEKTKVINKLQSLNDEIAVADAEKAIELKKEYQKTKDDYAMKVSNFVDTYLNAYEITGGLEKWQANQIYYLFRLSDDDAAYKPGSVGEYYQNQADREASKEAESWAAPILDKYYDQTQNVYKDSSGTWHYLSPYGEQAYYNTMWGEGMKHQVGLRNIIEGRGSDLKSAHSAAVEARKVAMNNRDFDLYNQIGADFDAQLVEAIMPYVNEYGAESVINNSSSLEYLIKYIFVPSDYMVTKKGRYVPSLAHDATVSDAFKKSYVKSLFGIPTSYQETNRSNLLNPEVF